MYTFYSACWLFWQSISASANYFNTQLLTVILACILAALVPNCWRNCTDCLPQIGSITKSLYVKVFNTGIKLLTFRSIYHHIYFGRITLTFINIKMLVNGRYIKKNEIIWSRSPPMNINHVGWSWYELHLPNIFQCKEFHWTSEYFERKVRTFMLSPTTVTLSEGQNHLNWLNCWI